MYQGALISVPEVGHAVCHLRLPDEMDLMDIVIHDPPMLFGRGLARLIPPGLLYRLKRTSFRQRGLGTALLTSVISCAQEKGVKRIQGDVTRQGLIDNPRLLDWYRKHGFEILPIASEDTSNTAVVASICMNLSGQDIGSGKDSKPLSHRQDSNSPRNGINVNGHAL
jgi:hypothetical protein